MLQANKKLKLLPRMQILGKVWNTLKNCWIRSISFTNKYHLLVRIVSSMHHVQQLEQVGQVGQQAAGTVASRREVVQLPSIPNIAVIPTLPQYHVKFHTVSKLVFFFCLFLFIFDVLFVCCTFCVEVHCIRKCVCFFVFLFSYFFTGNFEFKLDDKKRQQWHAYLYAMTDETCRVGCNKFAGTKNDTNAGNENKQVFAFGLITPAQINVRTELKHLQSKVCFLFSYTYINFKYICVYFLSNFSIFSNFSNF